MRSDGMAAHQVINTISHNERQRFSGQDSTRLSLLSLSSPWTDAASITAAQSFGPQSLRVWFIITMAFLYSNTALHRLHKGKIWENILSSICPQLMSKLYQLSCLYDRNFSDLLKNGDLVLIPSSCSASSLVDVHLLGHIQYKHVQPPTLTFTPPTPSPTHLIPHFWTQTLTHTWRTWELQIRYHRESNAWSSCCKARSLTAISGLLFEVVTLPLNRKK